MVAPFLDLEEVDDVLHPTAVLHLLNLGGAKPEHALEPILLHTDVAPEEQVLDHRHLGEQLNVLERAGDAELSDEVGAMPHDRLALPVDVALLGSVHLGDGVEDRRLSCAVRTDDRKKLTLINVETHVMDGSDATKPQGDAVGFEDVFAHDLIFPSGQPALAALVVLDIAERLALTAIAVEPQVELLDILIVEQLLRRAVHHDLAGLHHIAEVSDR